jgi:hypothetical protein
MKYAEINVSMSVNSVSKFVGVVFSLPQPVYVHCHMGWAASLFSALYAYKQGFIVGQEQGIFNLGLDLGWDYQASSAAVALINDVASGAAQVTAPSLEKTLAKGEDSYKYYYWSHRLGNDSWYNTGQVLQPTLVKLRSNGGVGLPSSYPSKNCC